jgi:hypothetical protein
MSAARLQNVFSHNIGTMHNCNTFFFVKMNPARLQSIFSHNIGAMHRCDTFFLCENEGCNAATHFFKKNLLVKKENGCTTF